MTFKLMNGSQGKLTFSRTFDLCYPPNEYVIHVASFDFSLVTALYMGMLAMQGYLSTNVIYLVICLFYYFVVFCRAYCGCLFGSNFIITPQ